MRVRDRPARRTARPTRRGRRTLRRPLHRRAAEASLRRQPGRHQRRDPGRRLLTHRGRRHDAHARRGTRPGGPYAWGIASHVIEHIPDLVGWLAQLADVVADDGVLVLAVPDKGYGFDAHRPLTTVGQILAAHEEGHTRPGVPSV
ncbi:MAG: methyltransferase domain-containing protein [Nocardioides sp.]|nr:methyltransferase domain-containing protein [Nocardioides sp.]